MQRLFAFLLALTAVATALPANALLIDAVFSGPVVSQTGTSFAPGSLLSGEFVYSTALSRYLSFVVGGQTVAPGFTSSASITPDQFSAIYEAQVSPVLGGSLNSTFSVDLEGVNQWPTFDALALLQSPALASNLDTTLSNFGFYIANADGTNVRSVTAALSGIRTTVAVPEPASSALLLTGIAALGWRRRRPLKR
jgi:hypothetical protein